MSMDLDEQYDKIYRYCYFRLRHRETAEDVTQETFLRFFESTTYQNTGQALRYLYTIARNLCTDEFRKPRVEQLTDSISDHFSGETADDEPPEGKILNRISMARSLSGLTETDRELLLLRYVNEVPLSVISSLTGISRFAVYRRLLRAKEHLKENLRKENVI